MTVFINVVHLVHTTMLAMLPINFVKNSEELSPKKQINEADEIFPTAFYRREVSRLSFEQLQKVTWRGWPQHGLYNLPLIVDGL